MRSKNGILLPGSFGWRFKVMRKQMRFKTKDFADMLEVDVKTICRYEQSNVVPRHFQKLVTLNRLGVDLNWLIGGKIN